MRKMSGKIHLISTISLILCFLFQVWAISPSPGPECPELCICSSLKGNLHNPGQIVHGTLSTVLAQALDKNSLQKLDNNFTNSSQIDSVTCTYGNLTEIPKGLPKTTKKLNLSWNLIEDVEPVEPEVGDFDPLQLPELVEIILSRNAIKNLPLGLLPPSILVANFEYNQIEEIPEGFAKNLKKLQILILGHNVIVEIDENAFDGLSELQILELNDNRLTEIPSALSRLPNLQELSLANNQILSINIPFAEQIPRIILLELRGNPLQFINPEAFTKLSHLNKLILSGIRNLTQIPDLNGTRSLEILRIDRCSISSIPEKICHPHSSPKLKSLDLKSNRISTLSTFEGCQELRLLDLSRNKLAGELANFAFSPLGQLHDLHLSHNRLENIRENSFAGLGLLKTLDLSYNLIRDIHPYAFKTVDQIEDLNLGDNQFPEFPTEGLSRLVHLKAFNNPNLREFPGPQVLTKVRTLVLSYAYHCCPFLSVEGSTGPLKGSKGHGHHNGELNETILYPDEDEKEFDRALSNLNLSDLWSELGDFSNREELANNLWRNFDVSSTVDSIPNYYENSPFIPTGIRQDIQCIPTPGPFQPCNDLFDWWTLRCGVWIVFLMSLMGNGTVVFVLIFARTKMDVPRFLVCNLAIADFFMGVYLGFLAVVDSATFGEFRRFAISWQFSSGCQMAGFLGVLSSELSVYTLAVITMERHYAITHAMHLNKRLSLRHAVYIMMGGWIFALLMAILPLFGISDYRKFAVCLPFEIGDGISLAYVCFLMFANGVAFLILMGCYLKMYCSIRGSQAWNSNDTRIAKRMALLVFTDLLCWAPIAFFSLTAMFGLQLVSLEEAKVFTVFILPLNSCCNPFLYAILTKQFKKDCVLICKAIEESRVTRGIGRCRHSSNFSNRQTAPNTGSLGDKSSKDGQPCICHSGCSSGGRGDVNGNAKWFIPKPETWGRFSPVARFLSKYVFCQKSKERSLKERDDYRMRNVRRYLYNNATNNFVPDVEKNHQRHPSVSSDNFSSRSDSWKNQGRCGNPLRLLEPRRRNSWAVSRKPSSDSNLSNSRNDSSATSNSNSTATWRLSRSSVSSDATNSSGPSGSMKRSSGPGSIKLLVNKALPPPEEEEDTIQEVSDVTVINTRRIASHQPPLLQSAEPPPGLDDDDDDEIEEDEPSAQIATNRPRLVRQSAFFSDDLVIEPEVCPVHGPLVDGTYDNENDDEDISDDENQDGSGGQQKNVEERELMTMGRMSIPMPTYPIALVIISNTNTNTNQQPQSQRNLDLQSKFEDIAEETASLLGGDSSANSSMSGRRNSEQIVRFSESLNEQNRLHSRSLPSVDEIDGNPASSPDKKHDKVYPGHATRKVQFQIPSSSSSQTTVQDTDLERGGRGLDDCDNQKEFLA